MGNSPLQGLITGGYPRQTSQLTLNLGDLKDFSNKTPWNSNNNYDLDLGDKTSHHS
jgi:hypothetical protein